MNIKKILLGLMVASTAFSVSAFAEDIKTGLNLETRDVTVEGVFEKAAFNSMISIEVAEKENPENIVHFYTFNPKSTAGDYKYTFRLPADTKTGYYTVTLGVYGQEATQTEIYYANIEDVRNLLLGINSETDAKEAQKLLGDNLDVMNISEDWYNKLDNESREKVAQAVLDAREEIEGKEYKTVDEIKNVVFDNMAVYVLSCAENEEDVKEALSYFKEIYNVEELSQCEDVLNSFGLDSEREENMSLFYEILADAKIDSKEDVIKEYDKAALLTAVSCAKDPDEVRKYLDTEDYREILDFDFTTYDKSDKDKTAKTVYSKSNIRTVSALEDIIEDAYDAQKKPTSGGGSSGGSSGSSSKGSGSGIIVNQPVVTTPEVVTPAEPTPEEITFSDINDAKWAEEAILSLAEKGIVSGMGDGTFEPNGKVTREQFVKMVVGAFGLETSEAESDFSDIDKNHWAYSFVSSAKSIGIVNGISETEFGTGREITRQDMAVMVYNAAKYAGYKFETAKSDFEDADLVKDYAKEAVFAMAGAGVINGFEDNTFRPEERATRAQAAKILYTVIK